MKILFAFLIICGLLLILCKFHVEGGGQKEDTLVFTLQGAKGEEYRLPGNNLKLGMNVNVRSDKGNKMRINSLIGKVAKAVAYPAFGLCLANYKQ